MKVLSYNLLFLFILVTANVLPRHIKTYRQQIQQQARFIKIEIRNAQLNNKANKNLISTDEIIL